MSDIQLKWDGNNNRADMSVLNGDLVTGGDLYTSVLISLFSDARAVPGDNIPDGTDNRRGCWSDVKSDGSIDSTGSRLWLISREKQTKQTLNRAVGYAKEALQWMINDGVAADVSVDGQWNGPGYLALKVTISRKDGSVQSYNYNSVWSSK